MMNQIAALALATAVTAGAPAPTQDTIQLTTPEGARLEVQNRWGTIHIRGGEGDQVRAWTSAGDTAMQVQQSGSVIRVSISDRWRFDLPRPPAPRRPPRAPRPDTAPTPPDPDPAPDPEVDVDVDADERHVDLWVRVPRETRLSVRGVETEIRIDSVQGPVEVQGVTEDVRISGARGLVDVNTVEGDVRLSGITGEVRAQSVAGDLILRELRSERIRGNTMEGDIYFGGVLQPRSDYEFTTHFGDVWMAVPVDASAAFDVNVRSGGVNADFGLADMETDDLGHSHRFVLGEGSSSVEIRTFKGSVYLKRPGNMPDPSSGGRGSPDG